MNSAHAQLVNTGIKLIGDEQALTESEKTIIVVGPARGGTSLVAGVLAHLGVFTGAASAAPVYEDVHLATPYEAGDLDAAVQIMRGYDAAHPIWAYKRPGVIENFAGMHEQARNPVYLFIFKDLFSMANRNSISMKLDVVQGLRRASSDFVKIIDFIEASRPNGMLLSYDRVMQNREAFVDVMIGLLAAGSVSEAQRAAALAFIDPNPADYLDKSRITRGEGVVEADESGVVSGRARYVANPELPVRVVVSVDGVEAAAAATRIAGEPWHRFEIALPAEPPAGSVIELRLSDDVRPFATISR